MKRIWMNVGVSAFAVFVTSVLGSACAHNDATIFIRQVFLPTIPTNGECTYTADVTQASESTGTVDVSYPSLTNYTPWVLIGNQIISQGNSNALQAETSRVIINGAITKITDLAGDSGSGFLTAMFQTMCAGGKSGTSAGQAACKTGEAMVGTTPALASPINPFSTVESTAIEPASGATASYGALALTLIDGATMSIMRAYFDNLFAIDQSAAFATSVQLLTYTTVEGSDLGGDTVESNEFEFPVTFTFGGLVSDLGLTTTGTYCIAPPATPPTMAQVCVYGQDAPASVESLSVPGAGSVPLCTGTAITIPVADAGAADGS